MSFKALVYAYILGGITFIPVVIAGLIFFTIYTSVPVGDPDLTKNVKASMEKEEQGESSQPEEPTLVADDLPKTRKGWLTMRRTFEESSNEGSYVTLVRSFLDARSKDPKRSRPKDMWYVALKGNVLYLYEDETMTECEAALQLSAHDVLVYPEGLLDGELFAKRNAICLRPKVPPVDQAMSSVTKEMKLQGENIDQKVEESGASPSKKAKEREKLVEEEKKRDVAREEALSMTAPWFMFVRSNVEMEDWYFSLLHASEHPSNTPTLAPLQAIFDTSDMNHLVSTLDAQPDVIPMRWLNALIGRTFFSFYRTQLLETYIIGRLMKKLAKVKRPTFLTDISVTEVSVGNKAPTFSKPMLKELTKEGDASLEVRLQYKGEVRITIEATATINIGARFKTYTVKLVLAAVLRELEGNLLVKVKRPPSNRIWYAFTQPPRMVLNVEPIVSDRQITWSMILNTIESRVKEIIEESVVMPNMDDIAFFESSAYEHRGGIWPDASRHEREETSAMSDPTPNENASASAPAIIDSGPPTPSLSRSRSAEALTSASEPVLSPPEAESLARSATEEPATTNEKQRTRDTTLRESATPFLEAGEAETARGRTTEVDSASSLRSRSTPNKSDTLQSGDTESLDESPPRKDLLSPNSRRSSFHQSSATKSHSPSSSGQLTSSPFDEPSTPSPASKTRQASTSGGGSQNNSPNSFFLTLKSRAAAADKQALKDTAKETMRKWALNWGGLKKDANGNNDDHPDHGSLEPRPRPEMSGSASHRARASYAEVRAAVADRKEKEKGGVPQGDEYSGSNGIPSSPLDIPDASNGRARTASSASSKGASSYNSSTDASSSLFSNFQRDRTDSFDKGSRPKQPPTPRSLSGVQQAPSELLPDGAQEITVSNTINTPNPSPIHTQPSQGKTMAIPGIHASHRNDVMSMGYVAPSPPPPPVSEGKNKTPAIQSVYRLWKSPVLTGQQQPQAQEALQRESQPDLGDRNPDVAPLTLSPSPPSPKASPSRIPPPLPPRSLSATVSWTSSDSVAPSTSENPSLTSASEALKSIASKDENNRSRASLERNGTAVPSGLTSITDVTENAQQPDPEVMPQPLQDTDSTTSSVTSVASTSTTASSEKSNPGPPLPPRRIHAPA